MVQHRDKTTVYKPVGLGLQIAEALKTAILEGDFKGGEQLGEQDLQARFEVSRSPLREAFRELEKLGLVEIVPRRGSFVKRITRKDIEEHFPIRASLEGLAARLAAGNMTPRALDEMGTSLRYMETAVKIKDTKSYYTNHLSFHESFIERAENDLLKSTLEKLRMQNLWHRFSYQYYQEDFEKSFQVHQEILHLFKEANASPVEIGCLVEQHINVALENFLVYLEEFERA